MEWLEQLRWDEQGLVAAIAQDARSGRVLTVAWMNREALRATVEKGEAVYWSRSRKRLWRKGEESGHVQKVLEVRLDCDADAILLTSMDRDGTRDGFDLALTRAVADAVSVPVIASGGVGSMQHLAEGVLEGRADAVLAASVFHFGDFTVRAAKEHMRDRGIEVRL